VRSTGGAAHGVVPARQSGLRTHNLALALREVATAARPVSRAGIAAATGLTRATASTLVDTLIAGGLVRETGTSPRPGGGRPGTGLVLERRGVAGLGLEVNVDYLAACVVDLTGTVRHRRVVVGDQRGLGPRRVVEGLGRLLCEVVEEAAGEQLTPAGAVLGVPGLVDPASGRLLLAPNLGWREVDLPALLSEQAGLSDVRVSVENEAALAALADLYSGSVGTSFVHVSGEVGIGAGIVLDGELYRGRHGWSGELGHATVEPDGPRCSCGARGCLEQYAGQEAILRAAGLPVRAGTALGGEPTVATILAHAEAGDAGMLAALDAAGRALGVVTAGALNLLDVPTVVLGGVYGALAPWLRPAVEAELRARVLGAAFAPPTVRVSALETGAAVVGAARSVVQRVLDDPAAWLVPTEERTAT
jgi:predicted NBD/HSP70 family sugar kinase